MGELAERIRSERLALVDFLDTLPANGWAAPSLCDAWTVQDVAAHLAWAPVQRPIEAGLGMVRGGFRLNKVIADSAVDWARRGTGAILEQLRVNAANGAKPMGVPQTAALADAVVHMLDIRRPLQRPRAIPQPAFERTAAFFSGARWPLSIPIGGSPRKRIEGLRLVADDLDWSHGHGPEVHGSAEALLLLLAGRRIAPDELTGPGAAQLYARL